MVRDSQAEQAYQAIKKDVITCELAPGAQIAQAQLAGRYQFGITPVREALQRLEQEGYLKAIPRFGYLVTPITATDVAEIYELRLVLELPAVRLAAQRGSDVQLAHIEDRAGFTYIFHDRASYAEFLAANNAFHYAVALLSGNRRLAESVARLLDQMVRIFHLGLNLRDSAEEMTAEHRQLAAALTRRDADAAEAIMQAQIERSRARVLDALRAHQDQQDIDALILP